MSYLLPLVKVEKGKYILWLNTLGETKLITRFAKLISKELDGDEVLVTMESYGIEFTHELSALCKQSRFVVCRTKKHGYMRTPIREYWGPKGNVKSNVFYLDLSDAEFIKGRRVVLVDEIVGARRAMDAIERLVRRAGGKVVKRVAMFSDGIKHKDIVCVDILPLFVEK